MTHSTPPKVSVCIPVYNGSAFIAETIESILAQTYENFHLIVCDNCSTDNTEEIARSFDDPRLTYVRNTENLGIVGNANRCLELANGEYVCIFHHDDIMMPDNLEHKVHLLDKNPEVGFVHSNLILINENGEIVAHNIWNEDSRHDYIESGLTMFHKYLAYLPLGASIFIGSVLARRACYKNLGGFRHEVPHCHDSEMWLRMLLFYDVACIGTPLVKYRVHPMSASTDWGNLASAPYISEHYRVAMIVINRYKDHIPQSNSLKRQVSLAFAHRALNCANKHFSKGDLVSSKILFKHALSMSPHIIKNIAFWKTSLKIATGPIGVTLYQAARNAFTTNAK